MTTDPKLVEALARSWFVGWRGPGHTWDNAPQDHRDLLMDRAREFFAAHRLVQLPEEPDLVLVNRAVPFEERHIHGIGYAKALEREGWKITARFMRLPGDPQEVDDD